MLRRFVTHWIPAVGVIAWVAALLIATCSVTKAQEAPPPIPPLWGLDSNGNIYPLKNRSVAGVTATGNSPEWEDVQNKPDFGSAALSAATEFATPADISGLTNYVDAFKATLGTASTTSATAYATPADISGLTAYVNALINSLGSAAYYPFTSFLSTENVGTAAFSAATAFATPADISGLSSYATALSGTVASLSSSLGTAAFQASSAFDASGAATTAANNAVANHVAAADPHPGYMLESNIGTGANNYLQMAASPGTPDGTKFLRDDRTWVVPSVGMTNPMDTAGDIIVGGSAGAPAKLAAVPNALFGWDGSGNPTAQTGVSVTVLLSGTSDDPVPEEGLLGRTTTGFLTVGQGTGTLYYAPVNDDIIGTTRVWTASKIRDYVDAAISSGVTDPDLVALAAGITGLVKGAGNGNGYSAAQAGTDYVAPDADLTSIAGGISGIVKGLGNGSGFSAASPGTDYVAPDADLTALAAGITGLVKGAGNGNGYSAASAGTDYTSPSSSETFTNKTYDANGTGNVLSNVDSGNMTASAAALLRKYNLTATFDPHLVYGTYNKIIELDPFTDADITISGISVYASASCSTGVTFYQKTAAVGYSGGTVIGWGKMTAGVLSITSFTDNTIPAGSKIWGYTYDDPGSGVSTYAIHLKGTYDAQ